MKHVSLLLFLSFLCLLCEAQSRATDSLKNLLKEYETKADSARISYYTAYIGYFYHSRKQYDSALAYYYRIINTSSFRSDTALLATTINGIGACYDGLGYPDSSLSNYTKALRLFNALKDTVRSIDVEANIAIVYKDIGFYEEAFETAFALLAKLESRPPDRALASCYTTIALVYEATRDLHKALEYHRKALLVRKNIKHRNGEAQSYHNIGETFRSMSMYDSALINLFHAFRVKTELDDKHGSTSTLNVIGQVYLDTNKPIAAEQYLLKALSIARESNDKAAQAVTLNNLGRLKMMRNQFREAALFLEEADELTRETKLINNLRQNLELKIDLFTSLGDYAKALKASAELFVIKDSLLNAEKAKAMKALEIKYESEQKEQQIVLLEQRDKISQARIQNRQTVITGLFAGVLLLIVIVALVYNASRIVRKSKAHIETLHKELHHRVKNNLQMLSNVLTLQTEQLTDSNAINAARSTESRINAMALIHRKLYNIDNNRTIDIRDYVVELGQYLTHAYGYREDQVKLNLNVAALKVDVDKAIPLGLILNELLSNSLKHAFNDHAHPQLDVFIQQFHSNLLVIVGDNGKGFDITNAGDKKNSFGIRMVGMLVKELRGNFSMQASQGTQYTLNIPAN